MPLIHSSDESQQRILEIADNLEETVKRIDVMVGYGRETRKLSEKTQRLTRLLAVSLVLDVILTVILGFLGFRSYDTTHIIHNNQVGVCRITNNTRAQQILLWKRVIAVSEARKDGHVSEQQKQLDKAFLAYVEKTFAPLDCEKIYSINK